MKKQVSRGLVLLLTALMLLALLPTSVAAAPITLPEKPIHRSLTLDTKQILEYTTVWDAVTGKSVETVDFTEDYAAFVAKGVSYDYATNTLTLTNAALNRITFRSQYNEWDNATWAPKANDAPLNIVLNGNNRINAAFIPSSPTDNAPKAYNALYVEGDVNIAGTGSLVVNNHIANYIGITAANISGKLTINSGNVEFTNHTYDALFAGDGILVNTGAKASLTASVTGPSGGDALSFGRGNGLKTIGKAVMAVGESKAKAKGVTFLETSRYAERGQAYETVTDSFFCVQAPTKIKAKNAKKTLKVDQGFTVLPVSRTKGAVVGACTFKSSNKKVATVDPENGRVTALSKGTTTITIKQTAGGSTAKCKITVK